MKRTFLFIAFFLIISSTWSQSLSLTKKQMYQDFDQLTNIIKEGNPQIEARKMVTGINQIKMIENLRSRIETISSDEEFNKLLKQALSYVLDDHSRETKTFYSGVDNLKNIDTNSIKQQQGFTSLDQERFPIGAEYYDDCYFFLGNHYLIHKNRKDTIHIQCMRLISFDGQDFGKYVEENYTPSNYDYLRRKYYRDWVSLPNAGIIKGEQSGKIIEFDIEDYNGRILSGRITDKIYDVILDKVPYAKFPFEFDKVKKVEYFIGDSILYIYMDKMVEDESFCNKIKETGRDKYIKKVVIDVRSNKGGSDYAWWNVLKAIAKDTLSYEVKLAYNDNKMMRERFKGYSNQEKGEIDYLGNKPFRFINGTFQLVPDSNSLNFEGKIFILADRHTYSAGFSLVNCAEQVDQLVSIGEPSGQIRGCGVAPQLFQLKHSKFTFRLACVMDVYNANKAIDLYKDFPEIIIIPDFRESMIYPRVAFDIKSKRYLKWYDAMYRTVLYFK